jgi:hypothetical protein
MVDHTSIRTGIDLIGNFYLTAQVEMHEAAPRVLALSKISCGELTKSLLSENGSVVVSLSDEDVIVKNIALPINYSAKAKQVVGFELLHSILDEPSEFSIDIIESNDSTGKVVMAARRNKLEKLSNQLGQNENCHIQPEGFVTRAVALGRGFIRYCSNDTERMVCLADFAEKRVSMSFVLGNRIIALAGFDGGLDAFASESGTARLAAELKTIINFKLNELVDRGLNVGLSRLVLTGELLNQDQRVSIAARLGVELEEPAMNKVMSDKPLVESAIPLSSYLVALGLTTE